MGETFESLEELSDWLKRNREDSEKFDRTVLNYVKHPNIRDLELELAERAYNAYRNRLGITVLFSELDSNDREAWILAITEVVYETIIQWEHENPNNIVGKTFKYRPILENGRINNNA